MKTAVVTGCTGGMGQILCKRLAEQGYALGICSNVSDALVKQEEELTAMGVQVVSGVFDIYKEEAVEEFFNRVEEKLGKINLLVNLAGISIPTSMENVTEASYDTMMDVNVKGTLFASKHFAFHAAQSGLIINIGSQAALKANGNAPIYCTAKAAVNMLSKGMQIQLGSKNIRITTLNPGGADTTFWGTRTVDRTKLMQASEVVDVIMFVIGMPKSVVIYDIGFESAERIK